MRAEEIVAFVRQIVPAIRGTPPRHERIHRARPFFTCYVEGL